MTTLKKKSKALLLFGAYLLLSGLAGFLSNPEKAKTALMSGGLFGFLCLGSGLLLLRGKSWAAGFGTGLCTLLSTVFLWRASVGWIAVYNGHSEKLFAAALISSMFAGALLTLKILWNAEKT